MLTGNVIYCKLLLNGSLDDLPIIRASMGADMDELKVWAALAMCLVGLVSAAWFFYKGWMEERENGKTD